MPPKTHMRFDNLLRNILSKQGCHIDSIYSLASIRKSENYACVRPFSSISRYDLLAGSLSYQTTSQRRPKVVLDAYSPTGFDVLNLLHFPPKVNNIGGIDSPVRKNEECIDNIEHSDSMNVVHMNSSIIVFPHSCFLWNITRPDQVTFDTLAIVALHKPPIQYLFIGSETPLHTTAVSNIQKQFKQQHNIIVEQMDIVRNDNTRIFYFSS